MDKSISGARFLLLVLDRFSKYMFCFPLKSKTQVFSTFKRWVSYAERRFGHKLISLQTDCGTEYLNKPFMPWLERKGLHHHLSNPNCHQENGVAERYGRTLQTKIHALLADIQLPYGFWAETAKCSCYIFNCTYSSIVRMTPYQKLHGEPPSLKHL